MSELFLMASSTYCPPPVLFQQDQALSKPSKDFQPILQGPRARLDVTCSGSINLRANQHEDPWKPLSGLSEANQIVKIDADIARPTLLDVKERCPESVLLSSSIAEKCTRHENILQHLGSGSSDAERERLDMSLISELMGPQMRRNDMHQRSLASPIYGSQAQPLLLYPSSEIRKPLLEFVQNLTCSSKLVVGPGGQISFMGTRGEMKDFLTLLADFYVSKDLTGSKKNFQLVPQFSWVDTSETLGSPWRVEEVTVAPLKSPEKVKLKPSPRKKSSRKPIKERNIHSNNYSHACETLLSLMINKGRDGKTTILPLKKAGPELPQLLTQFSASIAGTGLAVLFSVICKVAYGKVPLCASKIFNTGFGMGLVWLSWAVNKLRDTIVSIGKSSAKSGLREDEIMSKVDKNIKEIFFRAATVMAVAVMRFA
ncbi:hypothetical protein RJ641_030999 [Dillenia turbinata]|uniref:Uncharacterized protein n=1 Tax=Dillenia turbinata TaxID=194707 RepID=A0AAN8VWP8_9MAGN